MDPLLKRPLLEELMQRLGNEAAFERVAVRAGVPPLVLPGYTLERRYEQQIERLFEQSTASLVTYLEAAALEAGGGFEIRFALATTPHDSPGTQDGSSGWDIEAMRTAMVVMPPPELLPPLTTPEEEATTIAKPSMPELPPPPPLQEAQQLEQLQQNYSRKAAARSAPPVADFDKSVQIPSLAARLKNAAGEVDLEQAVESHVRGAASGALRLKEARLVAGAGPGGVGSVLRFLGEGLQAPLMLELEGLVGRRIVERVKPTEASALLSERNISELLPRRVRVVHRSDSSAWVEIKTGTRADAGQPWTNLRSDAAYVPAGEYRLPGEIGMRRLEKGMQLGLTPVTHREYVAFLQRSGYKPTIDADFLKDYRPDAVTEAFWSQPVIFVNHADAQAYCESVGGTLPPVEVWERAALGFGQRMYPWGDTFELSRANTREGRYAWLTSVAEFISGRGPYGHIDLAGNVWEWTSTPAPDPNHFLLKGGSWVNDKRYCANGYRTSHRPELRAFYIGFRVAWPLPKSWE